MNVQVQKIKVQSITFSNKEGLIDGSCQECPKTVNSFLEADNTLRRWADEAPKTGGYDKTNFVVTYSDGQTYSGRFDLRYSDREKLDLLGEHMLAFLGFYAGENCPNHMTPEAYRNYPSTVSDDIKQDSSMWLSAYEIGVTEEEKAGVILPDYEVADPEPTPEPEKNPMPKPSKSAWYRPKVAYTQENANTMKVWRHILSITDKPEERIHSRAQYTKDIAKNIRQLFKVLGIKGLSVTVGRGTGSRYITIRLPHIEHAHDDYSMDMCQCKVCEMRTNARYHLDWLITCAFPQYGDRSEYQTDYYDFIWMID